MSGSRIKKASLAEIRAMKDRGELFHDPDAPVGEPLGRDFWAKARIEGPQRTRSVHLKIAPDVFDFFVAETGGKGHLTRMQNVLKAYADARRGRT